MRRVVPRSRAHAPARASALAVAAVLVLAGCGTTRPEAVTSSAMPTAARPSASSSVPPTAGGTASPAASLPILHIVPTSPEQAASGTIDKAGLVTIVSEAVTDVAGTAVQTVECAGDLAMGTGSGVPCTVTIADASGQTVQNWLAYAVHGADGSPAVLLLDGAPLSDEFARILAAPDSSIIAQSVDPTFGSSPLDAQEVAARARSALLEAGSPVQIDACDGQLTFSTFDPVPCTGSAAGAPVQALVLPAMLLGADPGVVVVTRTGA
ncbi:hypothetical protein [Brachybacterium huguangmaarense]